MGLGAFAAGLLAVATVLVTPESPPSGDGFEEDRPAVVASVAKGARAWPRCPECGVIESVREIVRDDQEVATNDKPSPRYEVTVRFRDGTTTMFDAAKPRTWRLGSRVSVIGGTPGSAP